MPLRVDCVSFGISCVASRDKFGVAFLTQRVRPPIFILSSINRSAGSYERVASRVTSQNCARTQVDSQWYENVIEQTISPENKSGEIRKGVGSLNTTVCDDVPLREGPNREQNN